MSQFQQLYSSSICRHYYSTVILYGNLNKHKPTLREIQSSLYTHIQVQSGFPLF